MNGTYKEGGVDGTYPRDPFNFLSSFYLVAKPSPLGFRIQFVKFTAFSAFGFQQTDSDPRDPDAFIRSG